MDIDTSKLRIEDYVNLSGMKKVSSLRGGEYHGACPFCGGTDRFAVWPSEGKWSCRQCVGSEMTPKDVIDFVCRRDNIGFMTALERLGLKTANGATDSSKRGYRSMQDYAAQHGLDAEDLIKAGWQECEHDKRPALTFKTKGGQRFRFIDGNEPRWKSVTGFKSTWYGLDEKVLDNARKHYAPLFLCNGEISTLSARYYGIPAICVAGGGERPIPSELLDELKSRWDGQIAITLDCDEHGRKAAQKILEQLGDKGVIVDLGLSEGQDLADFARLHGANALQSIKKLIPLPPSAPVTHKEASAITRERLNADNTMDGKPIIIPFLSWHQFGGYAKIGWPSKITAGVGMSGHGKTSWLNTCIDALLKRGEVGVGLMPEFEQDEYHWDRLQRYSGFNGEPLVTAEMMMEWELWKKERELGVPDNQRMGRELSKQEKEIVKRISLEVESWAGTFELFPLDASLEDALLRMGDSIQARRSHGELVTFAAFDYIQILRSKGYDDTDNVYEHVLALIKAFCMKHKIHGLVTSQVNKTADKANREGGKVLGATDMRYVRDDKINLLVTLNVLYDELGNKAKIPNTNYYAGVVNIAKNNKGRTGKVNIMVDFEHLRWLDKTWESHTVNVNERFDDSNF